MRGILFTPDNIKATVDLRKTVTRRLDGLKEINKEPDRWSFTGMEADMFCFNKACEHRWYLPIKPRYQVGEVVYIKEAWAVGEQWNNKKPSDIDNLTAVWYPLQCGQTPMWVGKLRSPLFLPEKFARYFIQILSVRPERLQEITPEDCKAEGVFVPSYPEIDAVSAPKYKQAYLNLWNRINGKTYPWVCNPWLWRIEYKLVDR